MRLVEVMRLHALEVPVHVVFQSKLFQIVIEQVVVHNAIELTLLVQTLDEHFVHDVGVFIQVTILREFNKLIISAYGIASLLNLLVETRFK